jgi:hypothetical protein
MRDLCLKQQSLIKKFIKDKDDIVLNQCYKILKINQKQNKTKKK